jgi:hypothetical protein
MKITLCGSTRFRGAFEEYNKILTLEGHLVYSLGCFGRQASDIGKPTDNLMVTDKQKIHLDMIHLAKIEESDAIFVLDVGGYIGDSTKREIAWARMRGKSIYMLSDVMWMKSLTKDFLP